MGTGNPLMDALTASFKANFRFHFEPSKGMIVSDTHLPVWAFRQFAGPSGITIPPERQMTVLTEEEIWMCLMQIRSTKRLGVFLQYSQETQNAFHKLGDIWRLKAKFFVSLGVQKNVDGARSKLYIIRDKAASVYMLHYFGEGVNRTYDIVLDLQSPELLHGSGASLKAKDFKAF